MTDTAHPLAAAALRRHLLSEADHFRAAELSNVLIDLVNEQLNAANITMADSLLARGLTMRGIMVVAAAWWADIMEVGKADAELALTTFLHNLPDSLQTVEWDVRETKQ